MLGSLSENYKIYPEYFRPVVLGLKNFEIRKNDRPHKIKAGDCINLLEYDPKTKRLTGDSVLRIVTYVTDYAQKDGYVVFGMAKLPGEM